MVDQTAEACRWLHIEKGYTLNETARRLNITPSAVCNALKRIGAKPAVQRDFHRAEFTGLKAERAPVYAERDPCTGCGVRADLHVDHGCGRYRS